MRFAVLARRLALRAGDAEHLAVHVELHDLAGVAVGKPDAAAVDDEAAGRAEQRSFLHVVAVGVENLDALVAAVGDVDEAVGVERDRMRQVEFAGAAAALAPALQVVAVAVEAQHAVFSLAAVALRDVDVAVRRDGDVVGFREQPQRRGRMPLAGVSLDADTLSIDSARTEELRRERRRERLRQGRPGQEFLRELVAQRNKRELPRPALDFLDEITGFSPAFREQLVREGELAERGFSPLVKINVAKEIMDLTPYVKIVADEKGMLVATCSRCGFAYCEAREDYKLYCLIHERDPAEIYPAHLAPDKDWAIYREYYCPGCGAQVEAEQCPRGMTIIQEIRINDL